MNHSRITLKLGVPNLVYTEILDVKIVAILKY